MVKSKYVIFFLCLVVVIALQGFFVAQATTQITASNVAVVGVTESSAMIVWATDLPGDSQIRFAQDLLSLSLADWQTKQAFAADLVNHQVTLTGLNNNTYYTFEVRSTDQSGSEPVSGSGHFTTGANGLGDLIVSNISVSNITETSATITWTSSAAGDSQIRFATSEVALVNADWEIVGFYQPGLLNHSATLTNLGSQTTYYFEVRTTNLSVGDSISGTGSFITATPQLADLLPTDIIYDSSKLVHGTVVFFDSGIKNQKETDTNVFNIKWYVDGIQKGYGSHWGINGNTTDMNGNSQFNWIAQKGSHTIKFVVDADNHINESDENNNSTQVTVSVREENQYGNSFTWQGYTWQPIYVIYGNDPSNGYGRWYVDVSSGNLFQDQVSALHYKVVATSMEVDSNYEVKAIFNLRQGKEFALCGRMDNNGNGYCYTTNWGGGDGTMISHLSNNNQNPGHITPGQTFPMSAGVDYVMKLRFEGNAIKAKIYPLASNEPNDWMAETTDSRYSSGKIGFYSYGSKPMIKSVSVADIEDQSSTCTDTDNGRNYDLYGETTGYTSGVAGVYTSKDMCLHEGFNNRDLQETWCENNEVKVEVYNCLYGCRDGACIVEGKKTVISNVRVTEITENSARINWHIDASYPVVTTLEWGKTTFLANSVSVPSTNRSNTSGFSFDEYYILTDLDPGTKYHFKIVADKGTGMEEKTPNENFTTSGEILICENLCGDGTCQENVCLGSSCPCAETINNCPVDCKVSEPVFEVSETTAEQRLRERIHRLEYRISELEKKLVEAEKRLVEKIDLFLTQRLKGRILLQVEENGEAWYVDPETEKKFYLKDGNSAYTALGAFGLGISNEDLAKIPVGIEERAEVADTDSDGLDDKLEEAIGSDVNNTDSDNDGYSDGNEVKSGFNPVGTSKVVINQTLVNQLRGRILLQVEKHGEAWYLNPDDGKRYYMKDGELAYQIMRFLSLGITNTDLRKIEVGSLE
ncbi:MAG: hypothetical protein A2731_02495 [Candidatus Buchananbacteria bacterium RIFCSPHIGHO2_01_FULL_39_8]|uniref:Fibronectin type-III domain-containing protein n=1 Tax=Candidatus Buchananbacteria bacterium RIFCSPHIGHO2_01_FULL_39_8 TaxID=1797533 RepID=A0A1G1XVI7_9BACT|nr:MAG: hypothetical protein A2731_02495 [Candidatus Buchananbacteria bacterium RIFCSPHIGHO2_01_FULL_39_8]